MLANNNLKICRLLVRRDFRFHPVKNLILVTACALVAGLYSFVFLLGHSVEGAFLLNYQHAYGSASHILYFGLTEHQADLLSQNAAVKSTVLLSTIGQLSDPMMGQRVVKLGVTDRAYAQTVLSLPTTGRLPEKAGEIALDEYTMNSLGILHELGTELSLQWTDPDGLSHISQFTLCGWWSSPTNFSEACAWIAPQTAQELSPGYDGEHMPCITLGVTLYQPRDLDIQAASLLRQQGIPDISYTTNLAYHDAQLEQAENYALPFYFPALLVLACGYLMIYSIVHVAADQDNCFYAGLKALGTTPRQIRRILLEQGCTVCLAGLLPGWLIGFLLHFMITSRIVSGMQENPAVYFLAWGPFLLASAASLATTLLAFLLPAIRLSRMTPAQTERMASGHSIPTPRFYDGRTTIPRLAVRALLRDRWRTVLCAVSFLLSLLLVSAVWIQYVSLKEDIYLPAMSPWDYSIMDGSSYLSVQQYNQENRSITEETVRQLLDRPEVTSVSVLKSREVLLTASEQLRQLLIDYYHAPSGQDHLTRAEVMEGHPGWTEGFQRLEETGEYTGLIVSLEGAFLDYLLENGTFTSGSFDEEAFASGSCVLTSGADAAGISSPAAGDVVQLEGHTFQVCGSITDNSSFMSGSNSPAADFSIIYYLSPQAFDRLFPDQGIRQLAVDIDLDMQSSFEAYLDQYEQGLNRGVGITRRSEYEENFSNARLNTVLPQLIVSIVLLCIALLNFINMLIVKVFRRKQEFAVYESLGMTHSQLRALLLTEGILHAALIALADAPLTMLFAWFLMPEVINQMESWCMVYTFSLTPLYLALAAILLLSAAVPLVCLHIITRGSITERLHTPQ